MLNPTFNSESVNRIQSDYVADLDIAEQTTKGNLNFETGVELRLQDVYVDEVWKKLQKAGFSEEKIAKSSILEICAGNGFLTYSVLKKCSPSKLIVNDISKIEINENKKLVSQFFDFKPTYISGDIHDLNIDEQFDIVIGNSFLHHFHDVPKALKSIHKLLKKEAFFISLHEPTPLSTVVESAKIIALPIGIMFPKFINDIARRRYRFEPSKTDLWMFERKKLKKIFKKVGYNNSKYYYWGLFRPIIVQKFMLHISKDKPRLTNSEVKLLKFAIFLDSIFNKILPSRFFGSMCIVAQK